MSNKCKVMGHLTSIPKVDDDIFESITIPKEYALRMLTLFGDIERLLDHNQTIVPDSDAAKGYGSNPPTDDQRDKDEYTIHQRVAWMTSGYSCFIGDNKPDWTI